MSFLLRMQKADAINSECTWLKVKHAGKNEETAEPQNL